MSKDTGGPAFPAEINGPRGSKLITPGMTLRDYFAAAALQGMLADYTRDSSTHDFAQYAYRYADAMIAERNK